MISILIVLVAAFILILLVIDAVRGGYIFLSCLSTVLDASAWSSSKFHKLIQRIWNRSFRYRSKV